MTQVVIIGGSVAGIKAATALRSKGFSGGIRIVDEDVHSPHDKPPMSKQFLTGSSPPSSIALLQPGEAEDNEIDLLLGNGARGLDARERTVSLSDGTTLAYDIAVIATGARPTRLPHGPDDLAYLRCLDDALAIRSHLARASSVVVLGGGFLGCELASAARALGVDVTLVELGPGLMADALGEQASAVVTAVHREYGVDVRLGTSVRTIQGSLCAGYHVTLTDGACLECDLLLVAIGDRPNIEWLAGSPLQLDGGVLTDESYVTTTVDNVYAIGDVAAAPTPGGRHERQRHWTAAVEQAEVIADNIVHGSSTGHGRQARYFWSDQYDLKIQALGTPAAGEQVTTIQPTRGVMRRLTLHASGDGLTGAVTMNWPKAAALLRGSWFDPLRLDSVIRQLADGSEAVFTNGVRSTELRRIGATDE